MVSRPATPTNNTYELHELQVYRTATQASHSSSRSRIPSYTPPREFSLALLPWELQLEIISHLDVRGSLQLRRTCRLYFYYLTVEVIEKLFTENQYITYDLLNCCIDCLAMPSDGYLVQDEFFRPGVWKSMCFRCWRVRRSPEFFDRPHHRITFTNGRESYACTLCGWPIRHNAKHVSCKKTTIIMNSIWWTASVIHFLYVLMITTLVWLDFAGVTSVVIPAALNLFISSVYVSLLTLDFIRDTNSSRVRLPLELASTLIWTPAIFHTSIAVLDGTVKWYSYPIYLWVLFIAKLLCHLFNSIGLGLLSAEYDARSPYMPGLSTKTKLFYVMCSFLVYWARVKCC